MTEIVVSAEGLVKSHGKHRVLDNVNIELERGCITAILGPSGAGKSTLLRVIAGLEDVDDGQVHGSGQKMTDGHVLVPPEKRNVGLVFQDFSLFPHLTALDNVLFGLRTGSSSDRRQTAMDRLAAVEMDDKSGAYPHRLSGGEQQRVALARALAPEPEIVLLDEAFSGLDARLRSELRGMAVAELKKSGAAVLVVTHDTEEALFMADKLVLMVDGAIIQSGAPSQLYLKPNSVSAARLLGPVNIWRGPVSSGKMNSAFGLIVSEREADIAEATAMVRPEGLIVDADKPDGQFEIVGSNALGATTELQVKAPDGLCWNARIATATSPTVGQMVHVRLDPALTHIVA